MYPTLEAELARRGKKKPWLAKEIGMSYSTLILKLNGKGTFRLRDARKIKAALGVDIPLEELFKDDSSSRMDDYDEKQYSGLLEE